MMVSNKLQKLINTVISKMNLFFVFLSLSLLKTHNLIKNEHVIYEISSCHTAIIMETI